MNVYVVGSNNVVVISPDGQRHRQLLSSKDGLSCPTVLDYDKSTNRLLVVNEERSIFFCLILQEDNRRKAEQYTKCTPLNRVMFILKEITLTY